MSKYRIDLDFSELRRQIAPILGPATPNYYVGPDDSRTVGYAGPRGSAVLEFKEPKPILLHGFSHPHESNIYIALLDPIYVEIQLLNYITHLRVARQLKVRADDSAQAKISYKIDDDDYASTISKAKLLKASNAK